MTSFYLGKVEIDTALGRTARLTVRPALGILLVFLALVAPAQAEQITERTRQKRAAEQERIELRQKLETLRRDIARTEAYRDRAARDLAHAEKAISEASRALHELGEEQRQTQTRLERLSQEQQRLVAAVALQRERVGRLVREQYMAGAENRIKLLLSGDNPNRINRDLEYMGYVSRAQAKLIEALRSDLEAVENNRLQLQNAKDELDEIAQEERQHKTELEQQKARRTALLAQLSEKLGSQRREANALARDEQRLGEVVSRLSTLIAEQRKAEAAAERRRREQQARVEQARKETIPKAKSKAAKANPDAIDDDEPPSGREAKSSAGADHASGQFTPEREFETLRGRLRAPVKGELIARFGSSREEGPSLKGLFLKAPEGAEVQAVASGRVIFAEWLRGFGNLLILDHGSDYMTIYGNNQAVLKKVGDVVKSGEIIARAGNSGGNQQSGLYFETRHQGRPFDPLPWMMRSAAK